MIKKSLIVASLLFVGTSALAFDANKLYVGIGASSGSGTLTVTANTGGSATGDYDSSSTPFKIGYMLKNDNRFEFSLESMDHKFNGGTDIVSGWNMDWNFVYPNESFSPFWTVGFGSYTYEDTAKYFSSRFRYHYGSL